MESQKKTKRRKFTVKKLIDYAVSLLHPGGVARKPATRDGKLEVVVDLPCCDLCADQSCQRDTNSIREAPDG